MSEMVKNPECCGLPTYLMKDGKYFCLKCKKAHPGFTEQLMDAIRKSGSNPDMMEQMLGDIFGKK